MIKPLIWLVLRRIIRDRFPDVQPISTAELADWLEQADGVKPVLLDTRTEQEYTVSHLPGALWFDPTADLQELEQALGDLAHDNPIVTYCSVGYRSAAIAHRLQQIGYTQIRNLDGSIFQWANESRFVCRQGQVVHQVHPYNVVWGLLLNRP